MTAGLWQWCLKVTFGSFSHTKWDFTSITSSQTCLCAILPRKSSRVKTPHHHCAPCSTILLPVWHSEEEFVFSDLHLPLLTIADCWVANRSFHSLLFFVRQAQFYSSSWKSSWYVAASPQVLGGSKLSTVLYYLYRFISTKKRTAIILSAPSYPWNSSA